MPWTCLEILNPTDLSPEDASFLLMSAGAGSVEDTGGEMLNCYVEEGAAETAVRNECSKLGLTIHSAKPVGDQNWTQTCQELLEPIKLKRLTVSPILDITDRRPTEPNEILLIPALGFGTGHHVTTKTILEILEDFAEKKSIFRDVLDVGTGSGLLSLAAHKLFGATCLATDNDPDALGNARNNVMINDAEGYIQLSGSSLKDIHQKYDLLMANIFAEVLIEMMPDFKRLVKESGTAILSGILAHKRADVESEIRKVFGDVVVRWFDGGQWWSGVFSLQDAGSAA